MKLILFVSSFILSSFVYSQAEIYSEISEYDYGQIIQGANGTREFNFTNTGDDTLIITKVRTGDGGSYAYVKDRTPVLPGESGIIIFKYDTKRVGAFHKSITITSNIERPRQKLLVRIKGVVIYPPTTLTVENSTIDLGHIQYNDLATATFKLKNSGDQKLRIHATFGNYNYVEGDIFTDRIYTKENEAAPENRYQRDFQPNQEFFARITIRNIYGNTGTFIRKLAYAYNSTDTLWLTVTGTFSGAPDKPIVYEKHDALYYIDGKLNKRVTYGSQEAIVRIDHFERSNCVKSVRFDGQTGKPNQVRTYIDGVEMSKEFFELEK